MALTKIKGSGLSSDALTTVRTTVASVPLTQLEVSGTVTANAFVGDGSGLTGVTSYTDSDTAAYISSNDVNFGASAALFGVNGQLSIEELSGSTTSDIKTNSTLLIRTGTRLDISSTDGIRNIRANSYGSTEISYAGSVKLETTNTGVTVTGAVNATSFVGDGSGLTGVTSYTDSDTAAYLVANGYDTATNIVASIVDTAPTTLDTLNELAAALGDDPNFATTVAADIAAKLDSAEALALFSGGTGVTYNGSGEFSIGQNVATTATPTFAGGTFTGNVSFGDNNIATFGTGNDLQVWHSGFGSFVRSYNTTLYLIAGASTNDDVVIQGYDGSGFGLANYVIANGGTGEVTLHHYGAQKLATKSTGVDVTGTVTADGLTVNSGTTNTTAIFQSTDAGAYINVTDPTGTSSIAAEGQYMYIDVDKDAVVASSQMRFRIDGSTKVAIDDSGNLLVAKTSSSGATVGCELQANGFVRGTRDGGAPLGLNRKTSDGSIAVFEKDSISVGTISVTSSGTTYNTTSDYRLKDNVQPITDGAERIQKLNPVTHSWKADPDTTVDGFLAHEVQEAGYEYAVNGQKDGDDMQSMDYGRITPVIVAALQDALKEIEQLKARINELEAK